MGSLEECNDQTHAQNHYVHKNIPNHVLSSHGMQASRLSPYGSNRTLSSNYGFPKSPSHLECGPFGEQDDEQVFVQRVIPETDALFVRAASNGRRVCVLRSVDGTTVTSFCVHECEGSSRIGSRPRRFIITGHSNGAIQMWDLTTALEFFNKKEQGARSLNHDYEFGGPTTQELVRMLHCCDLTSGNSAAPTPYGQLSPATSGSILSNIPHNGISPATCP